MDFEKYLQQTEEYVSKAEESLKALQALDIATQLKRMDDLGTRIVTLRSSLRDMEIQVITEALKYAHKVDRQIYVPMASSNLKCSRLYLDTKHEIMEDAVTRMYWHSPSDFVRSRVSIPDFMSSLLYVLGKDIQQSGKTVNEEFSALLGSLQEIQEKLKDIK